MVRPTLSTPVIAAVLALGMTSLIRADARSDAEHARRRLEESECRVRGLCRELQQARGCYDAALSRRNNALWSLDIAQRQVGASSAAISDAQSRIGALSDAARQSAERATQRRADFNAAKKRLDDASNAVARYRAEATAIFESSPAFKQAAVELTDATAAHDAANQSAFDELRSTDVYADLYEDIEETLEQLKIERARVPANPTVLAAMSQAWIDAQNRLTKFRDDYLSRQPPIIAAKARLLAAQSSRAALLGRFNNDLANDASLKKLADAAAGEQATVAAIAQEINALDAQRASAENEIQQLAALVNGEQARLDQANRDIVWLTSCANSSWYEINTCYATVARLCELERCARLDYQQAAAELRRRIELADADQARRELEDRGRGPDHSRAELALAHQPPRGGIVIRGSDGQTREHQPREPQHENPPPQRPSRPNEEHQRIARGEEAVAQRQALDEQNAARAAAEHEQARRDQSEQEARQRAAQEAREARTQQAQLQEQMRQAQARDAKAEHDRLAREQAEREAGARSEREAREQAQREAKQQADRDAAQQKSEREARERADRESKQEADRQAKAQADREAREQAQREARQQADREAKQQADREAKQQADRDRRESESRQQQEQQRRQQQRDEDERRERQQQQQRDEQRRRDDQQKQDQARQQQEQQRRDEDRREQEQRRRSDDESRSRRESEQRDRDRDSKFRGK